MNDKIKGFILGVVTCGSLVGTAVYASDTTQIDVYFKNFKYMFDGVEKEVGSEQGFIYNGTTYVPLRFVGESFGKKVEWEEASSTIWIGTGGGRFDNLTDLSVARENEGAIGGAFYNNVLHIAGTPFMENGIKVVLPLFNTEQRSATKSGSIEYNLEGKYTKLTGSVGIDDKTKNSNALGTLKIIGDGKELIELGNLKGGDLPKNIDIDIMNVSKLQISFTRDDNGELIIDLVDARLY